MVKHIVVWKLKEGVSKEEVYNKVKTGIEALVPVIDVLLAAEVGMNINPNEKYDISLYSTFNKLEDVEVYAVHPEHVKLAQYIKTVVTERVAIDYEC